MAMVRHCRCVKQQSRGGVVEPSGRGLKIGAEVADEKKNKWISIMIVPEDGAGVKKWRMTTRSFLRFKILLLVAGAALVLGIVSMFSLGVMYVQVRHYQRSKAKLLEASRKVTEISARLDRYREKERMLRDLLGSDIELPKAPESQVASVGDSTEGVVETALAGQPSSEIERAIASRESMMRRRPNIWPVEAWQVINGFRSGGAAKGAHAGVDLVARMKSSVIATADGKITYAGMDDLLGLLVVIDHENGWETRYGHNASLIVKVGDEVKKGQTIAIYGGRDGSTTGTHLHFGVYYRGKPLDPLDVLPILPSMKVTRR